MKRMLYHLARFDFLWSFVWHPLAKFAKHMTWQRSDAEMNRLKNVLGPQYEVKAGPFAGMKYPGFEAVGSSLIGKLLGTYEAELNEWVNVAIEEPYDLIVDVGCAEGYYAVGFAMKKPNCLVYAYDTSERARDLCTEMAKLNGVSDRVHVKTICVADELAALVRAKRALIISDCEGGEVDLFTEEIVTSLGSCDVLIEAHDFLVRGISDKLEFFFQSSHHCNVMHSMLPLEKAERHPSLLVRETSPLVLEWLYSEGRPETMNWLFFTPKRFEQ